MWETCSLREEALHKDPHEVISMETGQHHLNWLNDVNRVIMSYLTIGLKATRWNKLALAMTHALFSITITEVLNSFDYDDKELIL